MSEETIDAKPSPFDDGELYDVLFHDFTYATDFYVGLAKEAKDPVLEVGCGTGRILLPCLQAGADVDGLDLSEAMLAVLKKKAAALKLTPRVHTADMADFQLPRRYALIFIAFNSFVHNLTQEAQLRCLECCRKHLLPGGVLAFDIFFPALAIIGAVENTRVLEVETKHPKTGSPLRVYDTRNFDRVGQLQHSINEVELLGGDGKFKTIHRSEFSMRWTYKTELALLLRVAGFARWEIYGGFDRRPMKQETDLMVTLAWTR